MTASPHVDPSAPVVVLKLGGEPLPHGALGAARSLGRLGVPVHVVSAGPCRALAVSRFVTSFTELAATASDCEVVTALHRIAANSPQPPVLVWTDDLAALLVGDRVEELDGPYRFPCQPPGLTEALCDKSELAGLSEKHDVEAPRTLRPTSIDDVVAFGAEHGYPVMVKAADPRLIDWCGGETSVARADDADELVDLAVRRDGRVHPNVVLQEYIPGGSETVWSFNGYFDEASECVVGFTGYKLRQFPARKGPTTLGVCAHNDRVEDAAVQFLGAVGYRGAVDAEFHHDPRNDRYLLIDVNPRMSASFRLFVGATGIDVVRALYLDLTGQPVTASTAADGRKWWAENYDLRAWRSYFGRDGQPWRELPGTLRGVREAAWFAPDDIRPFLAMTRRIGGDVTRRMVTAARPRRRSVTGAR